LREDRAGKKGDGRDAEEGVNAHRVLLVEGISDNGPIFTAF